MADLGDAAARFIPTGAPAEQTEFRIYAWSAERGSQIMVGLDLSTGCVGVNWDVVGGADSPLAKILLALRDGNAT